MKVKNLEIQKLISIAYYTISDFTWMIKIDSFWLSL